MRIVMITIAETRKQNVKKDVKKDAEASFFYSEIINY